MLKRTILLSLLIFSLLSVHAQEKLSLTDAVTIALKNNYSILVAKNEADVASNNNTPGNAGMLPSIDVNASGTQSVNDIKQTYSTGLEVDRKKVPSGNLSANAGLNWIIFDGFKMFATKGSLNELQDKSSISLKIEIENTLSQVITLYFEIVKNKDLLKATESALEIHEERVRISETKFNIGSSSKPELLQAKVDRNAQRSSMLKEKTAIINSKTNLNRLLGRPVETAFDVTDSIVISYQPKIEDLKKTVAAQNNSLLAAGKDVNIAAYAVKEIQSLRYPVLGVGANYTTTRVNNNAGLVLLNQNSGFNYGFTVSWNLFNGFTTSNRVKNAKLDYENYTLRLTDLKSQVEAQVLQAFRNFEDALELLQLEEENLLLAKENVTVGLERVRIGNATQVELKEAQKSLEDAVNRTVSARFDAKVAETELMRLNGELVK